MPENHQELVARLRQGSNRALARALSLIEDDHHASDDLIKLLYPHTGSAYIIGVTGSPGVGKSTLVDALVDRLSAAGRKCAVLAVDPTSPYSGGALLGDRIRMTRSSARGGVFIRSMASRGALGGLAPKATEALFAFDAAGYEVIVVETVGVGQAEVEIVRSSDTVVLVMMPGMGDGVQALKAGIIEIADVIAINKADYDGADRLQRELTTVMSLGPKDARRPKIVRTIASSNQGLDELQAAVEAHRQSAETTGEALRRRETFAEATLRAQLSAKLLDRVMNATIQQAKRAELVRAIVERRLDPASAALELIKGFEAKADS